MSGYTPVFRSVFQGSLCGQYPDTAAWLFLLALADKNGHVDMTPQYISAITGMPVDELVGCIDRFMRPDPASRGQEEEGRRLLPIDPARSWGWVIVNHGKYREKARKATYDAQRVEDGRNAQRMRDRRETTRDDPTRPDATSAHPPSDSDANTDTDYGEQLRSSSVGDLSPSSSERARRTAKKADENRRKVSAMAAGAVGRIPA